MKRTVVLGTIAYVVAVVAATLIPARQGSTQSGLPPGPVTPIYSPIGVATQSDGSSAAWLLDSKGNRVVVCTHGAAKGCARYDLP